MSRLNRRDLLKTIVATGTIGLSGGIGRDKNRQAQEYERPDVPDYRTQDYETIRVPSDQPTVQDGVDEADEGDLVLVEPGVYKEEVIVKTRGITVRGLDRNEVILEGDFERRNGITVTGSDGVVIENMTARHYEYNGFYWTDVNGYRGSYLTAYNNGDYGIYAFDSVNGRFEHSYASGHPDSGFYIGQCQPCHAVITDVVAENNALGYSGTNAGGDLTIKNSVWRKNMSGIVPNTLDSEKLAPQKSVKIIGNDVRNNSNHDAPTKDLMYPLFGTGITVAGGNNNEIKRNKVENHMNFGIAVIPNIDQNLWTASGNVVQENEVKGSGRADLALGAPAGKKNYFGENEFRTSRPTFIQTVHSPGSLLSGIVGGDSMVTLVLLKQYLRANQGENPSGEWKDQPEPGDKEGMPDPRSDPRGPTEGCCPDE